MGVVSGALSLSLSQPITVSIVHLEHTVCGGTSEEKSWFFFKTQKKKKGFIAVCEEPDVCMEYGS